MGGDMACEVGGVDGLGSGSAQLGLATRLFHSARLGSARSASALLVSSWPGSSWPAIFDFLAPRQPPLKLSVHYPAT